MNHKIVIFIIAQLLCVCSHGQIERLAGDQELNGASISASLVDAITGEKLESYQDEALLCPASVLKLVTTAAAMDNLGRDFRFSTVLAYTGEIKDRVLLGDLLIIGSGDPTFCSNHFGNDLSSVMGSFAMMVKSAGIDSIAGSVIGNGAHLQGQSLPGTRVWEDIGNYYGTGIHGLNVNDNTYFVSFSTDDEPDVRANLLEIYPEVPNLRLQTEVLSSTIQSDQAYIFGSPLESNRVVRGTLPMGRDRFTIKGSIPDPALFAAFHLRLELTKAGINSKAYASELMEYREPVTYTKLGTNESIPLSEMVKYVNRHSDNLIAEGLLLQLGAQKGNASISGGINVLEEYLSTVFSNDKSVFIYDGSGLSRFTAMSADQLTKLLLKMRATPQLKQYILDELPIAGREGTVKWFGQRTNLTDNVKLKSGSMKNVKAYAGIMTTYSGRELAFAILINNFEISNAAVRKKIEDWLLRAYGRY